jgi:hypothetical protein
MLQNYNSLNNFVKCDNHNLQGLVLPDHFNTKFQNRIGPSIFVWYTSSSSTFQCILVKSVIKSASFNSLQLVKFVSYSTILSMTLNVFSSCLTAA